MPAYDEKSSRPIYGTSGAKELIIKQIGAL